MIFPKVKNMSFHTWSLWQFVQRFFLFYFSVFIAKIKWAANKVQIRSYYYITFKENFWWPSYIIKASNWNGRMTTILCPSRPHPPAGTLTLIWGPIRAGWPDPTIHEFDYRASNSRIKRERMSLWPWLRLRVFRYLTKAQTTQ